MAKAVIHAGVCTFTTEVIATSDDLSCVNLTISSDCPNYTSLNEELSVVDALTCCFQKVGTGEIFDACAKSCPHAACPVPTGILKAVEVACNLALPGDVSIEVSK